MGHTALLVVHGIGAQERGETLAKLTSGLRRVDRDSVSNDIHDGVVATIGGQSVRLYEVYWADLLKGDLARGGFQIKELQSLSWFPWVQHSPRQLPAGQLFVSEAGLVVRRRCLQLCELGRQGVPAT